MMKKIYLTGIAASGKTTLAKEVALLQENIMSVSYSSLLSEHISNKYGKSIEVSELRKQSARIIEPEDIRELDNYIKNLVKNYTNEKHIILDSHAVTIEEYGIRVTPFSEKILKEINFDILISMYTDPELIIQRISENSLGRKQICRYTVESALNIQNSVLLNYASILNKPVYFLDSSKEKKFLVEWILKKINAC